MKRRAYIKGLASVGAITTIGATGAMAAPGDGDDVVVLEDSTGDNFGDGSLEHPTSTDFYQGVWDLKRFRLGKDSSRLYFDFEMAALENPFPLPDGWSHEYFQVYIRDPNADSGAPTSDTGIDDALNVDFAKPHHYVLLAHGEGYQALQDANGNEIVGKKDTEVAVEGTTISVSIPSSAVADASDLELIVLVAPYDGTAGQRGFLREVASSPGPYTIGGGDSTTPKVLDMITPEGVSQSDALSTSGRFSELNIPYVDISDVGGPSIPDVGGVTPTDTDGDGKPEDFDGDGDADADDALTYYRNRDSSAVRDNPQFFDYDGDGTAGQVSDALELYQQLTGN